MLPSVKVRYFLLSALLGLISGSIFFKSIYLGLFLIFLFGFTGRKKSFYSGLIGIFIIGNFYSACFLSAAEKKRLPLSKQEVEIVGKTINYAEKKQNAYHQHLSIVSFNGQPKEGKALLKYNDKKPIPPYHQIQFKGSVSPPPMVPDFDYAHYLSQFGISGVAHPQEKIKLIKTPKFFWQKIGPKIRAYVTQNIESNLQKPSSTIALGMTIGNKESLPEKESLHIKNSGLQHLIVVSGTNITLMLGLICLIFRRSGPKVLIISVFLGITIFWITVGPEPPVNRAFIFGLCGSLSFLVGKKAEARNLLLLAALIMGLFNPLLLTHSLSFWLSFLATLGLILVMPIFFILLEKVKINLKINLILSLTMSAQISVLALIIHKFGSFPSGGILSNILAEPVVPLIMIFTSLLAFLGQVPILNEVLSFSLFWLINFILFLGQLFSQWPSLNLRIEIIYISYALQAIFIMYGFFSQNYEEKIFKPFQAKLDLSLKATKIGSNDR